MGAFGALLGCVAIARQLAVRVLAAALAFVPAMLFGPVTTGWAARCAR